MELNTTKGQRLKKTLVIICCIAVVLSCFFTIVSIKLPMARFRDGGYTIVGLTWRSLKDYSDKLPLNNMKEILSAFCCFPVLLTIVFIATFYEYPRVAIKYFIIIVFLITIQIVAIAKTVKYCKSPEKK